jgi:hypothetical protein
MNRGEAVTWITVSHLWLLTCFRYLRINQLQFWIWRVLQSTMQRSNCCQGSVFERYSDLGFIDSRVHRGRCRWGNFGWFLALVHRSTHWCFLRLNFVIIGWLEWFAYSALVMICLFCILTGVTFTGLWAHRRYLSFYLKRNIWLNGTSNWYFGGEFEIVWSL